MGSEYWLVKYLKVSEVEIQIHFNNLAIRMAEKKCNRLLMYFLLKLNRNAFLVVESLKKNISLRRLIQPN